MSILITADVHWSDNPRDQYRWDFVTTLHKLIKERKVNNLLILGDLTEAKEGHKSRFVNQIADVIYRLAQTCMVTILKGNHDFIGSPDEPFFEFLGHIHNVDYIKVPTIKPIGLFLPWTGDWQRDWHGGKTLKAHKRVFCHQTFQGASFGFGGIAEEGVPLEIIAGIHVYSGDIHVRQTIKVPGTSGGVTYVGAPYRVDFGDDYEPRVLLLDGDKRISIPVKGRQKRLIELNHPIKSITDGFAYEQQVNKGDIVKFRINLDDASKFNEFKDRIYEWGEKNGVTIDSVQAIKTTELDKKKPVAKNWHKRQDKELVQDYGKRENLDERTLNIGLEIIE